MQGLLVGALVTVGFLGFFALVGLPVSYGVGAIARAVPWAGLATGAALALAGLLTLLGRQLRVPGQLGRLFENGAAKVPPLGRLRQLVATPSAEELSP